MAPYKPDDEFQRLLALIADDRLSDEQELRLNEILSSDVNAREHYLHFISLLTSLQWTYAEAAAPSGQTSPKYDTENSFRNQPERRRGWRAISYAFVAAAAVLLTVITYRAFKSVSLPEPDPVATLSRAEGARWKLGSVPLIEGGQVLPGRIQLEAGDLQLLFTNGATVAITGPADLEIESVNSVVLNSGRVRVHAPKSAAGFSLATAASRFVDLGTEFGVAVNDDQSSEVHVFDGLVLARPTGSDLVIPVMKQEAARVELEHGGMASITADASLFPKLVGKANSTQNATPLRPQKVLLPGARVVFLGRWETDREVHLHMMAQALAQLPKAERPTLFNAGNAMKLFFTDEQLEKFVLLLKPTHVVIEYGPQITSKGAMLDSPPEFANALDRLIDTLLKKGIEPILRTSFRVCDKVAAHREFCEAYDRIIRAQAQKRGLRLVDVASHFSELPDRGESLLLESRREPTFEGSWEIARIELTAFGYPDLEIPRQLEFRPLSGLLRDWSVRILPSTAPLAPEEVAHVLPDGDWKPLQLPQADDILTQRSPEKWRSYIYRSRAQGYAFISNFDRKTKRNIEAVNFSDSDRERNVFINTGGTVFAVWLNGEKIYEDRKAYAWHPGRDRIPAHLKIGRNTIVVEAESCFFLSVTENCDWTILGE